MSLCHRAIHGPTRLVPRVESGLRPCMGTGRMAPDGMSESLAAELEVDPAQTAAAIGERLRHQLGALLQRRGLVVAMSGGVDSSVCAALAVRAVGASRVFGLLLPERESDPDSLTLARSWAEELGVEFAIEEIGPILDALGCYWRRNQAIRQVVPEFEDDWRCKVVLPGSPLDSERLNVPYIAVELPDGTVHRARLPAAEYRQIVAATNFKQRTRKMLEYYHADRLNFAVAGTPNRLEYDQGFFDGYSESSRQELNYSVRSKKLFYTYI